MKFRPCIDIHNGKVKQIIGGSLKDEGDKASENFIATNDSAYYANMFASDNLKGGHVIMLNSPSSEYRKASENEAMKALKAYPCGLQIGGGITPENAREYLDAGASHVIITSYLFDGSKFSYKKLDRIIGTVGKEHLVLDLSCRLKDGKYYVVTDRWQTFTDMEVTSETLKVLADKCDEFLIHGVDVEGKSQGVDAKLISILSKVKSCPITYAGGVAGFSDLDLIRDAGCGHVDVTIGSALSIYGGNMEYANVLKYFNALAYNSDFSK